MYIVGVTRLVEDWAWDKLADDLTTCIVCEWDEQIAAFTERKDAVDAIVKAAAILVKNADDKQLIIDLAIDDIAMIKVNDECYYEFYLDDTNEVEGLVINPKNIGRVKAFKSLIGR